MKRMVTTTIMALALALTPVTVRPAAAAQTEDLLGLLLGLGALYAIGTAIDDNNSKNRQQDRKPHRLPEVLPRHKVVPLECLRTYYTRNGPVRGFSKSCTDEAVRRAARLPDRCEVVLRTDQGRREIYAPNCLRREGWQAVRFERREHREDRYRERHEDRYGDYRDDRYRRN